MRFYITPKELDGSTIAGAANDTVIEIPSPAKEIKKYQSKLVDKFKTVSLAINVVLKIS